MGVGPSAGGAEARRQLVRRRRTDQIGDEIATSRKTMSVRGWSLYRWRALAIRWIVWASSPMFLVAACGRTASSSALDAAPDSSPGECPLGPVTFRMLPPATGAVYQYVASLGDPGDGIWWYSVATADGTALSPFLSPASPCAACDFHIYPIGYLHTELTGSGVSETWKGLTVTGTSTCTEGPGTDEPGTVISCNVTKCMPAGKYVVTMCGSAASSTGPSA